MGTPEIILIILSLFFFIGLIFGVVFLVNSIFKKKDDFNHVLPVNHYVVNLNDVKALDKINNATSTSELGFKEKERNKIALPQQHEIRYVSINEIMRCEADDNYTNFYLSGGEKILISKSLKEYADLLMPQGFLRTHQSHLVNPTFVKSWLKEDGGVLLMNNGDKIPVSKPNRESVKELLSK